MVVIFGIVLLIASLIGSIVIIDYIYDTYKTSTFIASFVIDILGFIIGILFIVIGIINNWHEERTFEIYNIQVIELDKNQTVKELNKITIVNPESRSEYYTLYFTDTEMFKYNITKNSKTIKINKSDIYDYNENKLEDDKKW